MTIDEERFRAINSTRAFLFALMKREIPIPKTKDLREKAYRLLKHYPEEWFVEDIKKTYYNEEKED